MTRQQWSKQLRQITEGLERSRAAQEVSLWQPNLIEEEETEDVTSAGGQRAEPER